MKMGPPTQPDHENVVEEEKDDLDDLPEDEEDEDYEDDLEDDPAGGSEDSYENTHSYLRNAHTSVGGEAE